jgi:hypothetical protein
MGTIYILLLFPNIFKCKIGISTTGKTTKRRVDINRSIFGFVIPIWIMVLPFGAYGLEQNIHSVLRMFHAPLKDGSGKTEFFWTIPALPIAFILINLTAVIYWTPLACLIWLAWKNG